MSNILTKANRAILSRMFPQSKTPQYAKDRLKICKNCEYNSLNFNSYSFTQKVKLYLNKVLDYIFKVENFVGVCLHVDCGCNLRKKSEHPLEECPEQKWGEEKEETEFKSIYISNKK